MTAVPMQHFENVVAPTYPTLKLFMTVVPLLTLAYSPYFDDGLC